MSHKQDILALLLDGYWHSASELCKIYYKYTQRLFDLKKEGYKIETRRNLINPHMFDYKLIDGPMKPLKIEQNGQLVMQGY